MSIYKYVTYDTLSRILDGTIRLTQPGAFNDPFEMVPELYIPKDFEPENLPIQFDVLSPRRLLDKKSPLVDDDFYHDATSRNILKSLNDAIGILCLSKNESSLLMWAHYADNYSGAVIEFDEEHEFFKGLFHMEYETIRPKKEISYYLEKNTPIPIAELCVKPKEWEYENEYRIARSLLNCRKVGNSQGFSVYVLDIPAETIKSISFGERMTVEHQRYIFNKVKDTNISLSISAISNKGYEFRKELIKVDSPISEMSPFVSPRTAHIFSELQNDFGEMARWMIEKNSLSQIVNNTL